MNSATSQSSSISALSSYATEQLEYLIVKERSRNHIIPYDSIVRCEADSNYTKIIFTDRSTLYVSKCLKYIESKISSSSFVRIHSRHLVNTRYISSISTCMLKSVTLINGNTLSISRRRYADVKSLLRTIL